MVVHRAVADLSIQVASPAPERLVFGAHAARSPTVDLDLAEVPDIVRRLWSWAGVHRSITDCPAPAGNKAAVVDHTMVPKCYGYLDNRPQARRFLMNCVSGLKTAPKRPIASYGASVTHRH